MTPIAPPISALERAAGPRVALRTSPVLRPRRRTPVTASAPPQRDVALDLVRGLAMVILVVNHIHLDSALEYTTQPFLSAAEALVLLSGVVCGIVFGRRWIVDGALPVTSALLRRSGKLYVASVVVVALVGILELVPGAATDALTVAPGSGLDLYPADGPFATVLSVVTLAVGPWQFDVLGFFIAALALAPLVLRALDLGLWPFVILASWVLYAAGRATMIEVLPSMSERPFPLLIWQVLFVHGLVLGWYRSQLIAALRPFGREIAGLTLLVAGVAAYMRLHEIGLDPLGLDALLGYSASEWAAWDREHFSKTTLDPARLVSMVAFTGAAYILFQRMGSLAERTVGRLLLPLGRNSFYVFIVQVFLCLAVASLPPLAGAGLGLFGNTIVQIGCLALLWFLVSRRFLFRWIPR